MKKALQIVHGLVYFLGLPTVLLLAGGDWRWWSAWIYIGLSFLATVISRVLIARAHPDLISERASYDEKSDTKPWDRILSPLVAMVMPLLYFIVAGLDKRFDWSIEVPVWIAVVAWVVTIAGFAFTTWAFVENRFFSAVVRIQSDRGHTVVNTGPYRIVRHPGYAGSLLVTLMFPLILETFWAYIPISIFVFLLVIRTAKEDQTLKDELSGYREYSKRTRFRLIPGLW